MRSWGFYLIVFGAASFVLPMLGLQFKLLNILGEATPYVGGGLIAVGAVMLALSFKSSASKTTE